MKEIKRDRYLNRLISRKHNGRVKIITGIRRCGKSYLLFRLFRDHLISDGVSEDRIIGIALDKREFEPLRNPEMLYEYILRKTSDGGEYYIFIDEIQLSYRVKKPGIDESRVPKEDRDLLYTTFYDVLNDLMSRPGLDIYVTAVPGRGD